MIFHTVSKYQCYKKSEEKSFINMNSCQKILSMIQVIFLIQLEQNYLIYQTLSKK